MRTDPWIRNGTVVRVIDGDSCVISVDLGFRVWHQTHVRLLGIDAPERGEEGWALSRDNLVELLLIDPRVVLTTRGPDKYGDRWLGSVQLLDGRDAATEQLRAGFAVPYTGGRRP